MPKYLLLFFVVLALANSGYSLAATDDIVDHDALLMDHGGGHLMDMEGGMVMGQNIETLPGSCDRISGDVEITVHAGHKYAKPFPGRIYAFDEQQWHFEPCTRLTIHFINEDHVRHQWMMHGLPKYIYKSGMFHLEVTGPGKISGTIILPATDQTYLVHCDIAQHMEKGMKAQIVVGKGGTGLPSIPGVTPFAFPDSYEGLEVQKAAAAAAVGTAAAVATATQPPATEATKPAPGTAAASSSLISGMLVIGLAFGLVVAPLFANYFKGMTAAQIASHLHGLFKAFMTKLVQWSNWLVQSMSSLKGMKPAEIASRIYGLVNTFVVKTMQWINWLIQLLHSQTRKYLPGK